MTPTPGTQVRYHTDPDQRPYDVAVFDESQPLAATVALANADGTVNLAGIDQSGASFSALAVPFVAAGPVPAGDYCSPAVAP